MEMLVENKTLTPSGKDFLIAALDPMHDNQLKELCGWPDVNDTASIVRCIKQTQSVSVAAGTGNWDFSLNLFPFLNNMPAIAFARNNNICQPGVATAKSYGGLAGYQLAPGAALDIGNNQPIFQLCLDNIYSQGASRVIGLGIEVVNTTSKLHLQGQVITWRQPNATIQNQDTYIQILPGPLSRVQSGQIIQGFPKSVPQAMLVPGSRQWEAADGVYITVPFVGDENPPQLVGYSAPLMQVSTAAVDQTFSTPLATTVQQTDVNAGIVMVPINLTGTNPTLTNGMSQATKIYPLQQVGAYFQGLSEETTLSITMNVFVETFPTVAEPEILVLATPSASYDPVALQIFSNALARLPVAVPAGYNPFGEWFTDIVSTLSDWLTVPATAINPALGAGVGAAGAMAKAWRQKQGYDKKKKAQPQQPRQNRQLAAPSPQSKPRPQAPVRPNRPKKKVTPAQKKALLDKAWEEAFG